MADVRAIMAVSQAVVGLLEGSYDPELFGTELEFETFSTADFENRSLNNGVSLFLYRVFVSGVHRAPVGRVDELGRRQQAQLPVELHFFLTVWAGDASLQHSVIGWMMRTLADTPILPASVLNTIAPGAFRSDEVVDISVSDLSNEDLLRIWDTLGAYQLSVPYVARMIRLESREQQPEDAGLPVTERHQDMGSLSRKKAFGE